MIRTPIRAPQANAYAERFVATIRRECLDWILIRGRRHLTAVLDTYVEHHNTHRTHRDLALTSPNLRAASSTDLIGGLIHEYGLAA